MTDKPATLGDLIAQGAAQPDRGAIAPAADTQSAQASAQPATQAPVAQPDMRAEQQSTGQGAGEAQGVGGQVPSAATSATPGISQSASADAIERVRRRVSEETQAMQRTFATPWHGR
jgi:hypothetical protein